MYQLVHTQRACGTCNMWAGEKVPNNPYADPSKQKILINCSSNKEVCNRNRGASSTFSAVNSCGYHSPMFS